MIKLKLGLFGKEQETHDDHLTTLTNPIIGAKFTEAIHSVTRQGKAMIGFGSIKIMTKILEKSTRKARIMKNLK